MRSETMLVCNRNDGPEFKGAIFLLRDEIVPNRCKLQSLLAVSVTLPIYTNTENLISGGQIYNTKHQDLLKWLKNYVPDMHPFGIVIFHDSLPSCTVAAMEDSKYILNNDNGYMTLRRDGLFRPESLFIEILLQSTLFNSYPDNSDVRLIGMYPRPPFSDDQSSIIRLIRISQYSYYFIQSLVIRIRRIQLYNVVSYMG